MTNTNVFRKKLSHREIVKRNQEQNKINEDLGALNLRLAKEHAKMTQDLAAIRALAKNAASRRFSPRVWHRALVAIGGGE